MYKFEQNGATITWSDKEKESWLRELEPATKEEIDYHLQMRTPYTQLLNLCLWAWREDTLELWKGEKKCTRPIAD